ncbi:DUF3696 domain-containing protein [Dyadobacter sp. CY345]|uniref:AAA family ATPase n=1 Tax=Dyadobacter sp. CY345 TaxID=2909335 RepID=UPI001F1C4269|nr:DUF3696 domain-containing protein [Dyadobacter sp. CY345]MCF2446105.1 DUF3696 domain-containing protein [Dyadobacter sp. CY345]
MKIKSLSFENYKGFFERQHLTLKPLTILIGKNSSGKSSIAKLFPLLSNSLSGHFDEPLLLSNNNVFLGGEFRDLVFNRNPNSPIIFSLEFQDSSILTVSILQPLQQYELIIYEWAYVSPLIDISLRYDPIKGYVDSGGGIYNCEFRGFIPITMRDPNGKDLLNFIEFDMQMIVDYIGPFRVVPDRQFTLTGQVNYNQTGTKGEYAYSMLGASKNVKATLHEKVGSWFEQNFDGWRLLVENKNVPFIELLLSKGDSLINLVDVGQGMSQVLPLIVRAHVDEEDSYVISEQPELHLHPAAHGDIAELFAKSSKKSNQTFVVETHSENFLLRLRRLVISNDFGFTSDDIIIYFVDSSEVGQRLMKITIDSDGVLSDWPEGIFNENLDEVVEMRKALTEKKRSKE